MQHEMGPFTLLTLTGCASVTQNNGRQHSLQGGARMGKGFVDNPVYNTARVSNAVEHADATTSSYGVQIHQRLETLDSGHRRVGRLHEPWQLVATQRPCRSGCSRAGTKGRSVAVELVKMDQSAVFLCKRLDQKQPTWPNSSSIPTPVEKTRAGAEPVW
eukprot:1152435-Amphidinium_carterae.1